eukprot:jgi/Tetstr1/431791/TSEL_021286.t1
MIVSPGDHPGLRDHSIELARFEPEHVHGLPLAAAVVASLTLLALVVASCACRHRARPAGEAFQAGGGGAGAGGSHQGGEHHRSRAPYGLQPPGRPMGVDRRVQSLHMTSTNIPLRRAVLEI